jgi:uncharacterized protein (TIGR02147 family)
MSSIYSYTDYREYLTDELARKSRRNSSFSLRAAAAHIGVGSGTLSRILNGTRNIGPSLLPRIVSFLGLKTKEADYFAAMVKFSRTANEGKKRHYYEAMLRLRSEVRKKIPEETYHIFEQWYCLALHQLFRSVPDCADPKKLGAMLDPTVSEAKTRKAISLLLRCGVIRKNDSGGYSPVDNSLTTGETWRGMAIHGFQRSAAAMALDALERFPKQERDFSTLTLTLSSESFNAAREIIKSARQKLLALDEKENAPDRVYQVNFQMFPLSRAGNGERGST